MAISTALTATITGPVRRFRRLRQARRTCRGMRAPSNMRVAMAAPPWIIRREAAMSCHQSGEINQARLFLDKAKTIAQTKFPPQDSDDLGTFWMDIIIARTLIGEAETLIEGNGSGRTGILKAGDG